MPAQVYLHPKPPLTKPLKKAMALTDTTASWLANPCLTASRRRRVLLAVTLVVLASWFLPWGLASWRPTIDAVNSVNSCACVVSNASLTVAIECPAGDCNTYFSLDILLESTRAVGGCQGRTLLWRAQHNFYKGNDTDHTLLSEWPIGSSVACYHSEYPIIGCTGLCLEGQSQVPSVQYQMERDIVGACVAAVFMIIGSLIALWVCCCRDRDD